MNKLSHLIEALTILKSYGDIDYPTHCEHDTIYVRVKPDTVAVSDINRLAELGFIADSDGECFLSFRFGSC